MKLLAEATERAMSKQPGYVSANIHVGRDGAKVTNHVQWRSAGDFEAEMQNSEARAHMNASAELAERFEPTLKVSYTHEVS